MTNRAMTLVAVFLACVPGLSSAQPPEPVDGASQFRQVARQLAGAGSQLETISNALHSIVQQRTARPLPHVSMAVLDLELASAQCHHTSDLIWCFPDIKPEVKAYWRDYTLDVAKMKKSNLDTIRVRVQRIHVKTKGKAVLDQLEGARDAVAASLSLFEKAIRLLEQQPGKAAK